MNSNKEVQLYTVYGILTVCFILLSSCRTNPNPDDTTPPTIDWTVRNTTTDTENMVNGTGTVKVKLGQTVTITACVNDDGGVKELSSSSSLGYTCLSDDFGARVGPDLAVLETTPLGLDDKGQAWSRYCKFYSIELDIKCDRGFTFSSGSYSFYLSGKNFADLSTEAMLSFGIDP